MNAPAELRTIAIAAATITLAAGEEYAGIAFKDGAPSHHLVLLPGDVEKTYHQTDKLRARAVRRVPI